MVTISNKDADTIIKCAEWMAKQNPTTTKGKNVRRLLIITANKIKRNDIRNKKKTGEELAT